MLSPIMFTTDTTRKVFSNIIPSNAPIREGIPKTKASHFTTNIPIGEGKLKLIGKQCKIMLHKLFNSCLRRKV